MSHTSTNTPAYTGLWLVTCPNTGLWLVTSIESRQITPAHRTQHQGHNTAFIFRKIHEWKVDFQLLVSRFERFETINDKLCQPRHANHHLNIMRLGFNIKCFLHRRIILLLVVIYYLARLVISSMSGDLSPAVIVWSSCRFLFPFPFSNISCFARFSHSDKKEKHQTHSHSRC